MVNKTALVKEALESTRLKAIGDIAFNKGAEDLESQVDDLTLGEIESQVVKDLPSEGRFKSHNFGKPVSSMRPGLLEVLTIYFRYAPILRPAKIRPFICSLTGEAREEAMLAISLVWGPEAHEPRPPFPDEIKGEVSALSVNGNERERVIAKIILGSIRMSPL